MTHASPARLDAHAEAAFVRTASPGLTAHPATERIPIPIRLKVYDDLSAAEAVWRYVERSADCTVFQCYDWISTWQRHIGERNGLKPAIVVAYEGDRVLMLLPLAIRRSGLLRRLTWLGGEFCDYGAPLLAADFSSRVTRPGFLLIWQQITAFLQQDRKFRHDVVALEKMPETVGAQPNPFCWLKVQLNPSGAYLTQLTGSWEEFYAAKRSSATRRRDRSKRTRLAQHGEIRFVTAQDGDNVARTLRTLFDQKSRAFARMGVPNIFEPPGHSAFLLDLASHPKSRHIAHVSRLDVGVTPAAANLGLVFHGRYYHLLASRDDSDLSRFAPGITHLHGLLQHAIENGCREFDFTIGDERYKQDWCETETKLYDYVAAANVRGWPMAATGIAIGRTKRFIKQSPLLWGLVGKLRAGLSGGKGKPAADPAAD
jgi:CelD/BcsL family acetyltransferase involved in cellulose biosynthesis